MTIELTLLQAESLLTAVDKAVLPVAFDKNEFLRTLKLKIKTDTENQSRDIMQLQRRILNSGIKNTELTEMLGGIKDKIDDESKKIRDKYFDENGQERPKGK